MLEYGKIEDMKNETFTTKTKVAQGGRIVLPAKFRHALGIEIGENVTMTVRDDEIRIKSTAAALRRLQGLVKKHARPGVSMVDELIRERREEAKNE